MCVRISWSTVAEGVKEWALRSDSFGFNLPPLPLRPWVSCLNFSGFQFLHEMQERSCED